MKTDQWNNSGKEVAMKTDVNTNTKLNEITTQLNSNYEVYSSMSAKNQMEFNKYEKR